MSYTTLIYEKSGKVANITFNRPEIHNAFNSTVIREMAAVLTEIDQDSELRVVVLTGMGHSFSSGFDLNEFKNPENHRQIAETPIKYHRDLWRFPKPILAAVNGFAMGGGFDMATFCDIRICSRGAVFGHPEIKFGAATVYTPRRWIVGAGLARDLCLTGRPVAADEALRIGLVSEITAPEGLMERALELARMIAEAPQETLLEIKAYILANEGRGFESSFQLEHDAPFTRKFMGAQAGKGG